MLYQNLSCSVTHDKNTASNHTGVMLLPHFQNQIIPVLRGSDCACPRISIPSLLLIPGIVISRGREREQSSRWYRGRSGTEAKSHFLSALSPFQTLKKITLVHSVHIVGSIHEQISSTRLSMSIFTGENVMLMPFQNTQKT